MKKSEMLSLEKGMQIQHKRNNSILTVVEVKDNEIVCEEKTISVSNCTRWFDVVEIPEVVEPDNTILDDIEQADELTSEQDTTADTDTTTQDTEEQTNTSDLKDTDTQDNELHEDTEQTTKTHTTEGNTATTTPGTIRQNNLIRDINNLMDLHDVQMEAKKEYIKVSMPGKRGALCMIRPTRFGTGIHIDFKSKILAKLDENYRGMLIEQYNCSIYDKTRGYYRVFDCSDLEVLRTIILTAKQIA